jgi:Tfp pilus assembly protein PilN
MKGWRIIGAVLVGIALARGALNFRAAYQPSQTLPPARPPAQKGKEARLASPGWAAVKNAAKRAFEPPELGLALIGLYLLLRRRPVPVPPGPANQAAGAGGRALPQESEPQPRPSSVAIAGSDSMVSASAAAGIVSLRHCNVLQVGAEGRQLWHFAHGGGDVTLTAERRVGPEETLPLHLVSKSWRNLWQRKLNVAWLPANQVFLRVLQLPASDPKELPAMVEFQLEKLSPMPVAQVVWTFEALPSPPGQSQTVIVIIVARSAVESYLDGLEHAGYLADRLELPLVQQLLATEVEGDQVWLFTRLEGDRTLCLAAWWVKSRLQNLNLFSLPLGAEAGAQLADMLRQVAGAGEMEGWLAGQLQWRLVADRATAAAWAGALQAVAGASVQVVEPPPPPAVARLSARASTRANLVPAEFATRYRQQFIDRLWMRGLAAVGVLYLAVVVAYFGWLKILTFKKSGVDRQIAALSQSYTNALQLKARVQVFQDQLNLRFAALDCWKAVSENLPAEMNLTSLSFQRGKKLQLIGTVTAEQEIRVTDFNSAMSKASQNGQALFGQVSTKSIMGAPPGQSARGSTWSIDCDIKRVEVE